MLPRLAKRIGAPATHLLGLLAGAIGFALFLVIRDPYGLIVPMVLIGIAWSSILTMPYAILAATLPPAKLGIYMGLFNIFIVLPQLIVSTVMGQVVRSLFPGDPVWAMLIAAGVMVLAAAAMLRVRRTEFEGSRSVMTKSLALLAATLLLGVASPCLAQTGVDLTPRPADTPVAYVQLQHAEWTRNAVLYQLNTRQFTQEGTFAAAQKQLPRLKRLGVDIIWLMPIHPIGETNRKGPLGSPYSIKDYFGVNPEFGTMDDLKRLRRRRPRTGHARDPRLGGQSFGLGQSDRRPAPRLV